MKRIVEIEIQVDRDVKCAGGGLHDQIRCPAQGGTGPHDLMHGAPVGTGGVWAVGVNGGDHAVFTPDYGRLIDPIVAYTGDLHAGASGQEVKADFPSGWMNRLGKTLNVHTGGQKWRRRGAANRWNNRQDQA